MLHWGLSGKESVCKAGDEGSVPVSGRFPTEENGYPISVLPWEIPWTEEPGELQSMGSQKVSHDWLTEEQQMVSLHPERHYWPSHLISKYTFRQKWILMGYACSCLPSRASQLALVVKNLPPMQKTWDVGSVPGNTMDRGAWQAAVRRVKQSQTQQKWVSTHVYLPGICLYASAPPSVALLLRTWQPSAGLASPPNHTQPTMTESMPVLLAI